MEDVIRSSGKFELLDRMLYKLFRSGHRVLLFSQMTQVLDLLEDYCNYREYKHTRLDGNTKNEIRGEVFLFPVCLIGTCRPKECFFHFCPV